MLADLGADVIKVNALHDGYWMSSHIAMAATAASAASRSNLKDPDAMAVLHRAGAAGRRRAAQHALRRRDRLGVDYESLRAINPTLIYCHTRGFEHGPREGCRATTRPAPRWRGPMARRRHSTTAATRSGRWSSLGDTGNGFLSAIAIVQALYHRDRTGEGQFVDTSIIYAQLLNTSMRVGHGRRHDHRAAAALDTMQLGVHALYRLYETADGWLCVAARATTSTAPRSPRVLGVAVDRLTPPVRLARAGVRDPSRRRVVHAARRRRRAVRGVEPRLRARPVRRSGDDREGLGHVLRAPGRRPARHARPAVRLLGDPGPDPGTAAAPRPAHAAILHELGYNDEQVDKMIATGVAACPA